MNTFTSKDARSELITLLEAADISPAALGKDGCDEPWIVGQHGHIYSVGPNLFQLVVLDTPKRWPHTRNRLTSFCALTQEGDYEGVFGLDHLPNSDEAEVIRDRLGIRKRREMSPELVSVVSQNLRTPVAA